MTELTIPQNDMISYAALPDAVKSDVAVWIDVLRVVNASVAEGCALTEVIAQQAQRMVHRRGFSAVNIARKWRAVRRGGWRGLVNGAKLSGSAKGLPDEFIEHWRGLCERNQRKCKPAHRRLIADWRAGLPIPGYDESPTAGPDGIPPGWGYANLMRHAPTKYELTAARIGRSAAAAHRPLVYTTRVGLEVGQFYMFDDVEHDHKVNMLGVNMKALRPLELAALDVFSACKFAYGMKPMIWNEVKEKKEKLKDREMLFLLAYVLTKFGYRAEGTTLVVEHGTAAVRTNIEKILADCTGGAVTVNRSGIEGAPAFAGQYRGRKKGNFRLKAALESIHALAHNELAALTGQLGMDRNHSPEELYGRDKHNEALLQALVAMPPERRELLRAPFLEMGEFQGLCAEIYEQINRRTKHDLEGWEQAGLIAKEWRVNRDMPWMPVERYMALPEGERATVEVLINSASALTQIRKLSPREVWDRGSRSLTKLQGCVIPMLLGQELAVERRVEGSMFEFQDREVGPGTHRYLAQVQTQYRVPQLLKEGETYLTYINPFDPAQLHVCDARGAYVGACAPWTKIRRDDVDALHRRMGQAAKLEATLLAPVARRGGDITRRRIADAKWNAGVLADKPMTKEEKEVQRNTKQRLARNTGSVEDFIPEPVCVGADEEDDDAGDITAFL